MRITPLSLFIGAILLAGCTTTPSTGNTNSSSSTDAVACTMEAKLCPDGSYVGRVPPSCAFAPCPGDTTSGTGDTTLQSVSDGTIAFTYPVSFGLAVTSQQILSGSYIPSCDEGFKYCLYYIGGKYRDTNFESAGIGITKRIDIADKEACLQTQPDGYTGTPHTTHDSSTYSTSVFNPVGDAAMGHYAHDNVYRLAYSNSCYEFRTRIGATQFANYPAGTKKEFTTSDEATLQAQLDALLGSMTLAGGEAIVFPEATAGIRKD